MYKGNHFWGLFKVYKQILDVLKLQCIKLKFKVKNQLVHIIFSFHDFSSFHNGKMFKKTKWIPLNLYLTSFSADCIQLTYKNVFTNFSGNFTKRTEY